ncbi:MAG: ABC transporter ATP-binding protein [Bacteroidota bacterium]
MSFIFEAKNVSKSYASHVALNEVYISVPEQSIFGLLGPNGAGKTSLIRIINQITGPDSGELFFKGDKLHAEHSAHIGYLPEERGLYKKMAVGEQALYLAQLKGLSKKDAQQRLKHWFAKFEIEAWWDKKVEELSKGMQQKVQFIVTVLHQPELLILDEPFSGFDPINANLIKQEILELKKNGTTIIFSTHNMGSVEELCDHITLINNSKNILSGSVKDIRKQFKTNTYNFTFKGNLIAFTNALWTSAELISKQTDDDIHHVTLKLAANHTPNMVLQGILPHCELLSFSEVIPSMNDIFIQQVNQKETVGTQSNFTE